MDRSGRRRTVAFRPRCEHVESRQLLSTIPTLNPRQPFLHPFAVPIVRPNTPVAPYGAVKASSFIDPSVGIVNGQHIGIGNKSFIGPFARLDARGSGFIKIGGGSNILDAATIISSPNRAVATNVLIGDLVSIGYGATVIGPATIGTYGKDDALPTAIGAGSLILGATITPGAIVGPLARVGPGVTVPAGMFVLPGASVNTNAEASNPALGKVAPITAAQLNDLATNLAHNQALALGYQALYQGNTATGVSPGVPASRKGVNNGDLASVLGAGNEPSQANGVDFEPANPVGPLFLAPNGALLPGLIATFRARVTGQVNVFDRSGALAHRLGYGNAIRADEGQPIQIGVDLRTGNFVVIGSPSGSADDASSQLGIFDNVVIGDRAMIFGGPGANAAIGNNANVGPGAIIDRSTIGANATIGARAYVSRSTLPNGTVVPPGAIIINNQRRGTVQW